MPHKAQIQIPILDLERWLKNHEELVTRELESYLNRKVLYWSFAYVTGEDGYPFVDEFVGPYWPVIRARVVVDGYRDVALVKLRRVVTALGIGYLGLLRQA
jgi:hypothetical protein